MTRTDFPSEELEERIRELESFIAALRAGRVDLLAGEIQPFRPVPREVDENARLLLALYSVIHDFQRHLIRAEDPIASVRLLLDRLVEEGIFIDCILLLRGPDGNVREVMHAGGDERFSDFLESIRNDVLLWCLSDLDSTGRAVVRAVDAERCKSCPTYARYRGEILVCPIGGSSGGAGLFAAHSPKGPWDERFLDAISGMSATISLAIGGGFHQSESGELPAAVFDALLDPVYILDEEGRILLSNASARIADERAGRAGCRRFPDLWDAPEREEVARMLRDTDRNGSRRICPIRLSDRACDVIAVPFSSSLLPGSRIAVIALEAKNSPWSTRDSQARIEWEAIFQSISSAVAILDSNRRILRVNGVAEEIAGSRESDLVGRPCVDLFPDSKGHGALCPFPVSVETGEPQSAEIEDESSGCTYQVTCTPVIDLEGSDRRIIHVATDITTQRQAMVLVEAQAVLTLRWLRSGDTEAFFDSLWDHLLRLTGSRSALLLRHADGRMDLTGRSGEERVSRTVRDAVHPCPLQDTSHPCSAILSGISPVRFRGPERGCILSDPVRPGALLVGARLDTGGEEQSALILEEPAGTDHDFHRQVLSTFARVTELLLKARRETEKRKVLENNLLQAQKMETIGNIAGGIAHDFNNMLSVIQGYASLALKKLRPGDPVQRLIHNIREAADRSAGMTGELLGYARRQAATPEVLDIVAEVSTQLGYLKRLIGERIECRCLPAPGTWPVYVDRVQVGRILSNLLANARDAMPDGGTVTISIGNVTLDDAFTGTHPGSRAGDYVRISVEDSGVGMEPDQLDRIFEPYYTTKGRGTGLGLAGVYGIVKQNGGYIEVQSEPGRGSRFSIYLPRWEGEVPAKNGRSSDPVVPPPDGKKVVMLVVDDEPSMRGLIRDLAPLLDVDVIEAESAERAIDVARVGGEGFDLLLTDVTLPGMDGWELVRKLRKSRPTLPVIIMSGYSDANGAEEMERCSVLAKPFDADKLRAAIDAVMGGRRDSSD